MSVRMHARMLLRNLVPILCALLCLRAASVDTTSGQPCGARNGRRPCRAEKKQEYDPDQQHIDFTMLASFGARACILHQSLSQVAKYLPIEGEKAHRAVAWVERKQKLLQNSSRIVGKLIQDFYDLEKKTMSVLSTFHTRIQLSLPLAVTKKNMDTVSHRLDDLESLQKGALHEVTMLEKQGVLVKYQGNLTQLQEVVLEKLTQSGSRNKADGFLVYLDEKNRKVATKHKSLQQKASLLQLARAMVADLTAKIAVYQWAANVEERSFQFLHANAAQLEASASAQAVRAGHRFNRHNEISFSGGSHHSHDQSETEQECARKVKQYIREVKADARSQHERIKAAAETVAAAESLLEKTRLEMNQLAEEAVEIDAELIAAKSELRELERRAEAEKERFGGISLPHIASLKHHMQEFPHLLGAQGMQKGGMFGAVKGALHGQAKLVHDMRSFLKCSDDVCVKIVLPLLRPTINQAITDASLFAKELAPLKDGIAKQMAAFMGDEITLVL